MAFISSRMDCFILRNISFRQRAREETPMRRRTKDLLLDHPKLHRIHFLLVLGAASLLELRLESIVGD